MFRLIALVCSSFVIYGADSEASKLRLVQVLSRHGDRSPVIIYPNDPNKKECWPEGLGEITLLGKKQLYAVGLFLRSMYQDFITTNPREVLVNSSATNRCLTSAATTMASFFNPEGLWKFEDDLPWQPISIHYTPVKQDKFLSYQATCPRVEDEMAQRISLELKEIFQKYQTKFEELSTYTGMNVSEGMNAIYLYDTLVTEKIHNLSIPYWVDFYWDELKEAADALFVSYTSSPLILRLRAGPLLQDIERNMMKKINGVIPDLKVQMYFAHDANIITILRALNFTNMPRPSYCANLLFELHEMADTSMTVRLLYFNSTDPLADMGQPHVLILDGCSEFCPVKYFTDMFQQFIPDNWKEECQLKSPNSCYDNEKDIFRANKYQR